MSSVIYCNEIGGPENLKLEDLPAPEPGSGEVRLQVRAVGLNRAEALYMRARYLEQLKLPSRIGYEAAGIVEAIGPGVDKAWLGKRVATVPGFSMKKYGVLGEQAIVPAEVLGEYPANLSFTEAAAIWMQYMTAYGALITLGNLKKDDFVVIPAASSSVGIAAIQITKGEGATAIAATRSSKKRNALLSLGADHVSLRKRKTWSKRFIKSAAARVLGSSSTRLLVLFSRSLHRRLLRAVSSSNMAGSPCSRRRFPS